MDSYQPISNEQLDIAEGFAETCTDGDIRSLILDLVKEIREGRAARWSEDARPAEPDVALVNPAVLATVDPVLWVSLKALERGARALEQTGLQAPAVYTEMITTLAGLVEQSTAATERPF